MGPNVLAKNVDSNLVGKVECENILIIWNQYFSILGNNFFIDFQWVLHGKGNIGLINMKTVGIIIIRIFNFLLLEMFNMSCALWISKSVKNTAWYFLNVFEHGLFNLLS